MTTQPESNPLANFPNADQIAFARRHAYMMKEGFFDGVKRDANLLDGDLLMPMAEQLAECAGITFDEAVDAICEWADTRI